MKKDRKLYLAIIVLIALTIWLVVLSITKDQQIVNVEKQVQQIQASIPKEQAPIKGIDGKTPILGVDYFNGQPGKNGADGKNGTDGKDGAQGQPGVAGVTGEKGAKGDPAPELQIDCVAGHIAKKYTGDTFWQPTDIKCEVDSE